MTLHDKLIAALMAYDRKQSTKRGYNPYALGIYFERAGQVCADIQGGKPVRKALLDGFSDRLLTVVLKAAGESDFTASESTESPLAYTPSR